MRVRQPPNDEHTVVDNARTVDAAADEYAHELDRARLEHERSLAAAQLHRNAIFVGRACRPASDRP